MSDIQSVAAKLLENESSDEVLAIKRQILKRIALESDVKPARIPAPLNITEIGGYFNMMESLGKKGDQMKQQTLTSILGLPVQYNDTTEQASTVDAGTLTILQSLIEEIANLKAEVASLKKSL